jgi:signal transduction histidine kinase
VFLGKRMQDVLPPEVGAWFVRALQDVAGPAGKAQLEYSLEIAGSLEWYEGRVIRIGADDLIVVVRNVTEQRRDREAVLRLNAELEDRVRERTAALEQKNVSLAEALESLKRAQAQLVQSEKMASLGLLVAGIAHEIKNPLNFVNNFAELALEFIDEHRARQAAAGAADPAEVEATLRDVAGNLALVREHGQRADGIINSMLMHARDRRDGPIAVDFNAMVVEHAALAYHGFRASDRALTVEFVRSLDPAIGHVMVPYQELARVIVNLVSNACHSMRERLRAGELDFRPTLSLSTRRVGAAIELAIGDNGTGIRPDVRRRIFDPFFTTKPPGEGTGLGLSLSYEIIVKGWGGSIDVESAPGDGARFVVRIPAAAVRGE